MANVTGAQPLFYPCSSGPSVVGIAEPRGQKYKSLPISISSFSSKEAFGPDFCDSLSLANFCVEKVASRRGFFQVNREDGLPITEKPSSHRSVLIDLLKSLIDQNLNN
jgi:hypothetical protein